MCSTLKAQRPWGFWEVLFEGDGFKVKRIEVLPGQRLSLQSHQKRSELWVVVKGVATVTIGSSTKDVKNGETIFIPINEKHRLSNKGNVDLKIVEIQNGSYLEEDDIVRYEDDYARE